MIAVNPSRADAPARVSPPLRRKMYGRGRAITAHGQRVLYTAIVLTLGYLIGLGHGARFFTWARAEASGWVTFQKGEVTP